MKIVARRDQAYYGWEEITLSGYSLEYMAAALQACYYDDDFDDFADCGFTSEIAEVLIGKDAEVETSDFISFVNGVLVFEIDYSMANDTVWGTRTVVFRVMEA